MVAPDDERQECDRRDGVDHDVAADKGLRAKVGKILRNDAEGRQKS